MREGPPYLEIEHMGANLSRREFFFVCLAPALVGATAAANAPDGSQTEAGTAESRASAGAAGLAFHECPECRGLGKITCSACDGTGLWTEASESAGLYQREAGRATDHCAWCNERGEGVCRRCEGAGSNGKLGFQAPLWDVDWLHVTTTGGFRARVAGIV